MKTTKTLTKNVMATLLLASTFVASNVLAQECLEEGLPTKPDEDFVILDEDQVLDTTSDLVWRRCSEGQTWSVDSCVGEADKFSWQQALVQKEQELVLVSNSSASLKKYKRKLLSSEEE